MRRNQNRSAGSRLRPLPPLRRLGTPRCLHPRGSRSSRRSVARPVPRGVSGCPRPCRRCMARPGGPAAPGSAAPVLQAPGPGRTAGVWQGRRRRGHAGTAGRTPGSPDAVSGAWASRETPAGTRALPGGEEDTESPWSSLGGRPLRGPWSQRRDAPAARRARGPGEHRPPSTGRSVLTGAPGPLPGARGGAPAPSAVSSRGPRGGRTPGSPARPRCNRSLFLPPRSRRAPLNAEAGANKAAGTHGRREGPRPGARCPGPAAGRAPSALSASFFPRWLRRPRYRELPPRCPNTSAAAASPPLIGRCCCDVTQTPPLGRHGPRPHSAHRHTHVDPELLD